MKKLTIEQIEIPESIQRALSVADMESRVETDAVKVALLSLATNPIVPSEEEAAELHKLPFTNRNAMHAYTMNACAEWQRRAFLRKPDPVPEEVQALMWVKSKPELDGPIAVRHDADIIAAFNLGKQTRDAG